jgi:NAD(P)-dependent dehydrogenase (short-subunit alcohol dehydrogenase family)
MDLQLAGRRALITGSSSGLGTAIAELLAAEGAAVVVHGRNAERTAAVAKRIRASGGRADVAIGDLATDDGAAAVAEATRAGGEVDILVNNAGAYQHRTWADIVAADWSNTYENNVVSGVRMIAAFVPEMRARGWGRVIHIGGGLGLQPIPVLPDYSATLAARHNLSASLSRDLRGSGVTSNVVAPGSILIEASRERLTRLAPERNWGTEWDEIEANYVRETVPNDVGRMGRPEEIAYAVAYLASPRAAYVTGTVLRVDGGVVRSMH